MQPRRCSTHAGEVVPNDFAARVSAAKLSKPPGGPVNQSRDLCRTPGAMSPNLRYRKRLPSSTHCLQPPQAASESVDDPAHMQEGVEKAQLCLALPFSANAEPEIANGHSVSDREIQFCGDEDLRWRKATAAALIEGLWERTFRGAVTMFVVERTSRVLIASELEAGNDVAVVEEAGLEGAWLPQPPPDALKFLVRKEIQTGVYTYGLATRIGDLGSAEKKQHHVRGLGECRSSPDAVFVRLCGGGCDLRPDRGREHERGRIRDVHPVFQRARVDVHPNSASGWRPTALNG